MARRGKTPRHNNRQDKPRDNTGCGARKGEEDSDDSQHTSVAIAKVVHNLGQACSSRDGDRGHDNLRPGTPMRTQDALSDIVSQQLVQGGKAVQRQRRLSYQCASGTSMYSATGSDTNTVAAVAMCTAPGLP